MRITHEASLYPSNLFLTLTYSPEKLPANGSLVLEHWQKFMKRLKKRLSGRKIRFYMCGEYGETNGRPHYHAILFDINFEDKVYLKTTDNDDRIYTSKFLDEVWSHGDCYIGSVTFQSAAYCGRYVMKKLTGSRKSEYGELLPEFQTFSRNPGVGAPWLQKFKSDIYPHDFAIMNGQKVKIPTYYDRKTAEPLGEWVKDPDDPQQWPIWRPYLSRTPSEIRKGKRLRNAAKHSDNNTPERLAVRAEILSTRLKRLVRS